MEGTLMAHIRENRSNHSLGTSGNNSSVTLVDDGWQFKAVKISFYFIILFGSAFGNSMVAYIICSTRRMKTASNFLIFNLAICDLSTPLISIPFDFALEENQYVWMYGGVMCRLLWPLATLWATSSALTLAAISLDRYLIIMHPFRSRLTKRQVLCIIVGIHCFSLIVVSPYIAFLKLEHSDCSEEWPAYSYRQTYTALLFVVQYAVPLAFMVIMYTLALFQLYLITGKVRGNKMKQKKEVKVSNGTLAANDSPVITISGTRTRTRKLGVSEIPDGLMTPTLARLRSAASKLSLKRKSANVRATWTFIGIVIIFACFMFPNQFVWLWADFGSGAADQTSFSKAVIICWLFTYTNSVVNPIIFAIFNNDFRNGFRRIFRRIVSPNRDRPHKLSSFLPESNLYSANNNTNNGPASESPQARNFSPKQRKVSTLLVPKDTRKISCSQVSFDPSPPSFCV